MSYNIELTDTFAGEANYCWVKRAVVKMPQLTHYGFDGSTNYVRANRIYQRELMRKAKAAVGITGMRGVKTNTAGGIEFRPYKANMIMFIEYGSNDNA